MDEQATVEVFTLTDAPLMPLTIVFARVSEEVVDEMLITTMLLVATVDEPLPFFNWRVMSCGLESYLYPIQFGFNGIQNREQLIQRRC